MLLSDTTGRILAELEIMLSDGQFTTKPQLEKQIRELIDKVNVNEVNLFDYRKSDSNQKFGPDIVEAISLANFRQQTKTK